MIQFPSFQARRRLTMSTNELSTTLIPDKEIFLLQMLEAKQGKSNGLNRRDLCEMNIEKQRGKKDKTKWLGTWEY